MEREKFIKIAEGVGIKKANSEAFWGVIERDEEDDDIDNIREGDRVMLNLIGIQSHPGYERLSAKYREFVEENADTVFTAERGRKVRTQILWSFKEDDTGWLFWPGDLIRVPE